MEPLDSFLAISAIYLLLLYNQTLFLTINTPKLNSAKTANIRYSLLRYLQKAQETHAHKTTSHLRCSPGSGISVPW
ncbi:MAG TPA: hypothetical protein PLS49_05300, partial [Candidatus Woesebacteria bacterium]|nr:hypothetical protein [Candidatus Woesebacteria bacterium]